MSAPEMWSTAWWKTKTAGGGFIGDITGAIETNLAKASRFVLFVDLGYAGYRAVTHVAVDAHAHGAAAASTQGTMLDAVWLVSQILAFDLSAPGLERIAREAEARGDKKVADQTRATKWAGIVLASLTFVEMGLIQLNWFPEYLPIFSFFLMVGRGIASVLVLNFSGIDQHAPVVEKPAAPQPAQPPVQPGEDVAAAVAKMQETLAKQIEAGLQQIKADVLSQSTVQVTEMNNTTGHGLFLTAGSENAAADMSYQPKEQVANSSLSGAKYEDIHEDTEKREADTAAAIESSGADIKEERTPASDPDRTEDKFNLALQFIRDHLAHVDEEEFDAQLAVHLNLKRPASARFWKLKVIEQLRETGEYPVKQTSSDASEQSTYERLLTYAHANQQRTQRELASILNVSERTIRRNLATMRKSGQLPANWIVEPDTKAATGQQDTGQQASDEDTENEERTRRFRVVR